MAELLLFPGAVEAKGSHPRGRGREQAAFSFEDAAPDDQSAREQALDITRSWIVEAPAGSGKTGLLLQRFLKLLAYGGIAEPEEVLAITFTRKATAELRERVLGQLSAAADGPPLGPHTGQFERSTRELAVAVLARDAEAGWNLLDRPGRLNLRTIDSLCGEIARTLPLLSGSGGAREPTADSEELYRVAAQRTLNQLGGPDLALDSALRTVLLHRDGSLTDTRALLVRMLGTREQWGRLLPLRPGPDETAASGAPGLSLTPDPALNSNPDPDRFEAFLDRTVRPRLERALAEAVCAGLRRVQAMLPAGVLEELHELAVGSAHLPGYNGRPSPVAFCRDRTQPPEALAHDLEHWAALAGLLLTREGSWRKPNGFAISSLGFKPPKHELDRLRALVGACEGDDPLCEALCAIRSLPPAQYPEEQWTVVKALFRLLRHALVELKLLFAERRQCDFTELSLAAREALTTDEGASDLAEAVAYRLRHLLVDEMQDTSSSQYDLLALLIASWGGEGETLFLVGDPKQSIYLFRQARVERFLRTVREGCLGPLRLEPLRLSVNFRSQGGLVEGFNRTFSSIFPAAESSAGREIEVCFTAAEATQPQSSAGGLVWHAEITAPAAGCACEEARTIRRLVERWQARPLPGGRTEPWRIAVLARNREHLASTIAEFSRKIEGRTILFRGVDLDPLTTRPEILDLLALTRALLHPADRVAWLAVLHAPWCGLGRRDLLLLTGEGPGADAEAPLAGLIEARMGLLSPDGQAHLQRAWPVLREAMQAIRRTPLSITVERTWRSLGGDAPLESGALANALRFFGVLRGLERGGGDVDLRGLGGALRRLYAEPQAGAGAVELLTIHKSKGLEWDVVLVPGLERRPRATSYELLNWLELDGESAEAAHAILAPIHGKGGDSDKLNKWLRSGREARETAETKRLVYVAATRARQELHLFGTLELKKDGTPRNPAAGTLLKACWPAAEPHFMRAAAELAENARSEQRPFDNGGEWNSGRLLRDLAQSLATGELALAASADETEPDTAPMSPQSQQAPQLTQPPVAPLLHRLPLSFNPLERFTRAAAERLPYPPAAALRHAPRFERPEGSFAVRAFGNVVHRFLLAMAVELAGGKAPEALAVELQTWDARLLASLRAEGLPSTLAAREAQRALRALRLALEDEQGRWLLSPHQEAASEQSWTLGVASASGGTLRVDRTFLAGPQPLAPGNQAIWIIDFKTTEPGGRNLEDFCREERRKYEFQLEAYATVRRAFPGGELPLHLGLYYPLVPCLIHWTSGVV